MAILYLLAHIDRGNIGNAKIEGMDKDLGLVRNQYNIASTIFFVPYIIFGWCQYHLQFLSVLILGRGPFQHYPQEGPRKHLVVIPCAQLGYCYDLYGRCTEFPRSRGLSSHSGSIRGLPTFLFSLRLANSRLGWLLSRCSLHRLELVSSP
jgi:hypothetical protein